MNLITNPIVCKGRDILDILSIIFLCLHGAKKEKKVM